MKLLEKEVKKVLLVYPNFVTKTITDNITIPPLGLETIAACILDHVNVKIIDAKVRNLKVEDLVKEMNEYRPDVVGISCCFTIGINFSLKIAREAKRNGYATVLGGWHPNFVPSDVLKYSFVDVVVRGEGEITFKELIQNKDFEEIDGISYKKEGKIINNPDRPLIKDINKLPIPARHLRDKKSYYQIFQLPVDVLETSRGCPYKCTFCNIHLFFRGTYRMKTPERVLKELKIIYEEKGHTDVLIVDDNFTANMKRVEKICDLIIEEGIKLDLMCQSRMDVINRNPRIIKKMARAGFWSFFCGIESFNQKSLNNIDKRVNFKDIIKSIQILHENNILIVGSLLIGADLDEIEEDTEVMIKIVKKLDIDFPIYSVMTPLPGTKFRDLIIQKGYLLSEDWSQYNFTTAVNRLNYLSKEKLEELLLKAYYNAYFNRSWKDTILRLLRSKGLRLIFQKNIFKVLRESLNFLDNVRKIKLRLDNKTSTTSEEITTFQI